MAKTKRKPATPLSESKLGSIAKVMAEETDRGCTLSAAALLDDSLEILIRSKFASCSGLTVNSQGQDGKMIRSLLFEGSTAAPLGSFGVRIKLCRALALVSKEVAKSLDKLREMRNGAAHVNEPFRIDRQVVANLTSVVSDDRQRAIAKIVAEQSEVPIIRAQLAATAVFLALDMEERVKQELRENEFA